MLRYEYSQKKFLVIFINDLLLIVFDTLITTPTPCNTLEISRESRELRMQSD